MSEQILAEANTESERRLNMIEAINDALDTMLARDPDVIVMGEDVGYFGGVFRATAGLQAKHGKTRVFDTPISECGIIAVAVGMGAASSDSSTSSASTPSAGAALSEMASAMRRAVSVMAAGRSASDTVASHRT